METEKDKELWKLAKKRVAFKRHLGSYIIVNAMFWLLWAFNDTSNEKESEVPWPIWPMLGWGIGLAFDFMGTYFTSKSNAVEREFEKLKRKSAEN